MKNKIWYAGYVASFFIILIIFFTDLPKITKIGLLILYGLVFSVSRVQILHNKMLATDKNYKIDIKDERNIVIKEKTGNITNMVNTIFLGLLTVIFISFDYIIPAIITGIALAIQPIILIIVSTIVERRI